MIRVRFRVPLVLQHRARAQKSTVPIIRRSYRGSRVRCGLACSEYLFYLRAGMGNEPELLAGRALNELRELKLEPRAATLAAHLIDVLRGDRTPLLLVDLDPADGRGFRWRDFQLYASDEQRSVGGLGCGFLHDQIPHSRMSAFQRIVAERQPPASG